MFRTKMDVERHVQAILRKVKNEQERNLRCYNIAQLYYKVHDYESAKQFVTLYISEKSDSSLAYKLLGLACEGLNQINNAISAYKKSLELEGNQADIVLKICELLCDKAIDFDLGMANYWVERATPLFPHAPPVFKLKERLMTSDSNKSSNDFEDLLVSELKARPNDVSARIKLLKLHVQSGRAVAAYNHTIEIESRQVHNNCLPWYQCINHICKAYFKEHSSKCDWEFYVHWLSAINRICALTLDETSSEVSDIVEAADAIFNLDQTIFRANEKIIKAPELYSEFSKHISAQLTFHFAVLLMKRARKETSLWKETKKIVAPLFLIATATPPNCDSVWSLSIKPNHKKMLINWSHEGLCRLVQSTHILLALNKSEDAFLQRVRLFTSFNNLTNDWRKQIFKKTFLTSDDSSLKSSHFVTSAKFCNVPDDIPFADNLKPSLSGPSFEFHYPGSLHHLVWLGLQSLQNANMILSSKITSRFQTTTFQTLQFTVKNLQINGVESLNQLDVDSFLYATVFCTGALLEEQKQYGFFNNERPITLPADITPILCTPEQLKWWNFACGIKTGIQTSGGNKISDLRYVLQKGIEVVRGEDLPLPLIINLARTFALRAGEATKIEESDGCYARAVYLWLKACQQLEIIEKKEGIIQHSSSKNLFEYPIKHLSTSDAAKLLSEGRYFIGCHYMKREQFEQAVEFLKPLRTVDATYNLALIYQTLAEEEVSGLLPNEVTLDISERHYSLLRKAKDYYILAKDIISHDHYHPLYNQLKSKIEDMISQEENENGLANESLGRNHLSFTESPHNGDSIKMPTPIKQTRSINRNLSASSTPSRNRFEQHRNNCTDLVELVNIQQSSNQLKMQQLLEQTRLVLDRVESIAFEQKFHRNLIEELSNKFSNLETDVKSTLTDIKKEVKKQDIYNVLDEEDYADEMLQYHNYPNSYYQAPRQIQNNSTAQYSAPVVPSYISPRAPEMYQGNLGFYNQGSLQFTEHQQQHHQGLSHFLRENQQLPNQKLPVTIQNTLSGTGVPGTPFTSTALPVQLSGSHLPGAALGAPLMAAQLSASPLSGTPLTGAPVVNPLSGNTLTSGTSLTAASLPAQPLQMPLNMGHSHPLSMTPVSVPQTINKFSLFNKPQLPSDNSSNRWPTNVVITTSDTLPTGTPPVQPTLSVTIPPQHRLGDSAAHQFQISMPAATATKVSTTAANKVESNNDTVENKTFARDCDLTSSAAFKQNEGVVGEESDEISFQNKSKLYRYDGGNNDIWKDRGLGILKNKNDDVTIMPMRKEPFSTLGTMDSNTPQNKFTSPVQVQPKQMLTPEPNKQFTQPQVLPELNKQCIQAPQVTPEPNKQFTKPHVTPEQTNQFTKQQVQVTPDQNKNTQNTQANKNNSAEKPFVAGGFSFIAPPKFKAPEELSTKIVAKSQEEKKPEHQFSNFLFTNSPSPFFSISSKDQEAKQVETPKQSSIFFTPKETPSTVASNTSGFKSSLISPQADGKGPFSGDVLKGSGDVLKASGGMLDFGTLSKVGTSNAFASPLKGTSQGFNEIPCKVFGDAFLKKTPTFENKPTNPSPFSNTGSIKVFGETLQNKSTENKSAQDSGDLDDSKNEEFVPSVNFEPVIPLPDEVKVVSGEENEKALFEDRAKLYRYSKNTSEWKERGVGKMKILKNELSGVVRLVMRREQVFKVCCNHRLTKDLKLSPTVAENVYSWAAKDFAEDTEGVDELFNLKFKTASQALKFKEAFIKAQEELSTTPSKPNNEQVKLPLLKANHKVGSIECSACCVRVDPGLTACPACNEPVGGKSEFSKSQSDSTTVTLCKPSVLETNSTGGGTKFTFGINNSSGLIFGSSDEGQNTGFTWAGKGFSFGNSTTRAEPETTVAPIAPPNIENKGSLFSGSPMLFGQSSNSKVSSTNDESTKQPTFSFGLTKSSSQKQGTQAFSFGSDKFQFAMDMPSLNVISPKKNESGSEDEDAHEEDEGDHIVFQPVIEMPDKIDVKTGEEDETVLYSHRAKLYRYATEANDWKERGLGDVKILKHNTTGKIRLLMRREKVMKVCLNHYITSINTMTKKDERSLVWVATDYSEGVSLEKFAIRFNTAEVADKFHKKILKAQSQESCGSSQVSTDGETDGGEITNKPNDTDDDVEILYEVKVSEELKKKALALQLPPNFYYYMQKPKCPGCVGCEEDEDEVEENSSFATKEDPSSSNKTFSNFLHMKSISFNIQEPKAIPKDFQQPLFAQDKTSFSTPPSQPSIFGGISGISNSSSNTNISFDPAPVDKNEKKKEGTSSK